MLPLKTKLTSGAQNPGEPSANEGGNPYKPSQGSIKSPKGWGQHLLKTPNDKLPPKFQDCPERNKQNSPPEEAPDQSNKRASGHPLP